MFRYVLLHFTPQLISMCVCFCLWFSVCLPVQAHVDGLCDVVSMACGQDHSLAVCASGHVFSWGAEEDGQLGNVLPNELRDRHRPRRDLSLRSIQICTLGGLKCINLFLSRPHAVGCPYHCRYQWSRSLVETPTPWLWLKVTHWTRWWRQCLL